MKKITKKLFAVALAVGVLTTLCACEYGESWERQKKTLDSEYNGGLNREITVYSSTGAEIWRFKGKFDIDYSDGRILFDDENDIRHTIYFENGTVIVNELDSIEE